VNDIAELLGQAETAVRAADDLAALDAVRVQFLGKKGVFTAKLRDLGKLPAAEIPAAGKAINDAKSDTGIGIPEESVPRLFERFYRVDKGRARDEGGTGLGLAIVKHVAQSGGGRVEVESELGVGTVFRVHLPLAPPAPLD
jgi:light-regulated signal transduction histidine kinase (bacteriophytochrome)